MLVEFKKDISKKEQKINDEAGKFKEASKNMDTEDWRVSELFEEMNYYAKTHPEYTDGGFLGSVIEFSSRTGFVTYKQYNVLLSIYYKNNMQNMEAFS